jgi:biotin carboxylase
MKPRGQAAAIGIRKLASADALWEAIHALGDRRADHVLEQFVPGAVFHVDSLVFGSEVVFSVASAYGSPPMSVVHEGGIFVTRTLADGDPRAIDLKEANARVLQSFGLRRGVSHTEFILGHDGALYFLETSARVGGAFIVDVVEAATGVNLWREWARVEIAGEQDPYSAPVSRHRHAGIVLSLARQEQPDTSEYRDPEITLRIAKRHHAGLIVASPDADRVRALLDSYVARFYQDFHASAPPPERATD